MMWPGGDQTKAYHLGTMMIANDASSPTDSIGNYEAVLSQKGSGKLWKTASVKGFPRKRLGHYDLLYRVLRAAVGERNSEINLERDEAAVRVAKFISAHTSNHNGEPADRLSCSYQDTPLLLSDLRLLVI